MKIHHIQYMKKRYGGSETYLGIVKKLSRFKHNVGFAQDSAKEIARGDPIFLKTYYDFKVYFNKKELREYGLIHSHFFIPAFFAQQNGLVSVCSSHCMLSKEFKIAIADAQDEKEKKELEQSYSFIKYLEQEFYPQINNLIVYSEFHKKELEELGAKTHMLKLPVNLKEFNKSLSKEAARKVIGIQDKFTILFLGRPTYLKGFHTLAEAYNNLSKKYEAQLLVVGDFNKLGPNIAYSACVRGNSQKEVNAKISIGGDVFVANNVCRSKIPLYFRAADVLVCPSIYEALGYVNLEAMASKIPVIGSNTAGMPYIISDRKTGLLFKAGDSKDLESKLAEIREDDVLRKKIVSNAWEFVQQFDSNKIIKKLDNFYEAVIKND